MNNDAKPTPRRRELKTTSMVQSIDDWLDKERKLIAAREKLKRRFIREMIGATATRVDEAERLFELLVQGGRLKRSRREQAEFTEKFLSSAPNSADRDSGGNLHRLRATFARSKWEIGKDLPQHPIPTDRYAICARPRSCNCNTKADKHCRSCKFSFVDTSLTVALRQRDGEIK